MNCLEEKINRKVATTSMANKIHEKTVKIQVVLNKNDASLKVTTAILLTFEKLE